MKFLPIGLPRKINDVRVKVRLLQSEFTESDSSIRRSPLTVFKIPIFIGIEFFAGTFAEISSNVRWIFACFFLTSKKLLHRRGFFFAKLVFFTLIRKEKAGYWKSFLCATIKKADSLQTACSFQFTYSLLNWPLYQLIPIELIRFRSY